MADLIIQPVRSLQGTLAVPGDKSISHRAFLLGALAQGTSRIFGCLDSDDVYRSRAAIEALGVSVRPSTSSGRTVDWVIEGRGFEGLRAPSGPLDMGNSGTTARLLMGILAGRPFPVQFFGDDSLSKRPMRRVTDPLSKMGAKFTQGVPGLRPGTQELHLPLTVRGGRLQGIRYDMPVASAQVKSALLLAGLQAEGPTTVVEPVPTRDHTERMLRYMGAKIEISGDSPQGGHSAEQGVPLGAVPGLPITIYPGELTAREIHVPGDFSSAAFFAAAAAMVPGSSVTIRRVGLNPTRTAFLELLRRMGAQIAVIPAKAGIKVKTDPRVRGDDGEWEPVGDVTVSYAPLKAIVVEPETVPNAIDELPVLLAAATQAVGVTRIEGAGELRVKETDRIQSMVMGLTAMGAKIWAEGDSVLVEGPTRLRGAEVDACGDHRTAMALAVAGLTAEGPTRILGGEWVNISFPEFPRLLGSIRLE